MKPGESSTSGMLSRGGRGAFPSTLGTRQVKAVRQTVWMKKRRALEPDPKAAQGCQGCGERRGAGILQELWLGNEVPNLGCCWCVTLAVSSGAAHIPGLLSWWILAPPHPHPPPSLRDSSPCHEKLSPPPLQLPPISAQDNQSVSPQLLPGFCLLLVLSFPFGRKWGLTV